MKLKILLLFTFSISSISVAQDFKVAMSVSRADLTNSFYEKDSTANALIIYDYGNSFIDKESFWLRVQIKQKIKILRTEGFEKATVKIKLFKGKNSKERISDILGATYNMVNGEIIRTKLSSDAIFEEENENYTLITFVLPNVKIGSIITYSYETQSRFITKYQPWFFQGSDPVLYSEYNTSIPGNYEYNIKLVGSMPLHINEARVEKNCIVLNRGASAGCIISKYVMKNIPAYRPEEFTTTPLNYKARIEYELSVIKGFDGSVDKLTKSWNSVDSELESDSDFGKQISRKTLAKNVLPLEIKSISNNLKKANRIYQFVLNNYRWNEKSDRYNVSIKNLLKEKIGSSFEINLLLENLLTSEGFKVFPVLISTRPNGLATKIHPVLTDFDYVVLKTVINNKTYFLDATNPYLSFGELPFKCLNQYGRLMDFEEGSYWIDIEADKISSRQHRVVLSTFEDDIFSGTIESKFLGYHAHELKRLFNENQKFYRENKRNNYTDISIHDHKILDFDKTKFGFNEHIDFKLEPEYIGNKIYLNPFLITFFEENPFKLQERTYPIDFGYKETYNYAMKIKLNDKLTISAIPDNISYALPNNTGSFIFNTIVKNNEVILLFRIVFNNAVYAPEFYASLKKFMSKVVETQKNTLIVFEKL